MKLLNNHQMKLADEYTIAHEPIRSDKLMERAARICAAEIISVINKQDTVFILCGPGNNGGDGFAIAWMLKELGYSTTVYEVSNEYESADQLIQKSKYKELNGKILSTIDESELSTCSVIIDALLGSGLSRPLEGKYLDCAYLVNASGKFVISIDSPSGFYSESPMPVGASSIKANLTLTFHAPKLMFFFPESEQYVGEWMVLDIGIIASSQALNSIPNFPYYYTLSDDLISFIKRRPVHSHKGNFGHALIAGGSIGKMGAIVLALKSCVTSGAGKTTAFIPASSVSIVQTAIPEAMALISDDDDVLGGAINTEWASAICFGPGAGTSDRTAKVLKLIIQQSTVPLLIDADGLNILSENPTWLSFLPANTILSPHPGEMDRLAGKSSNSFERLQNAREMAIKYGVVIVLKGAYTAIVSPFGEVFFNSTGNPGMAKGGSGDVLSGIITAFLAQGFSAESAAKFAVYLHGLAGDMAAEYFSELSMTPSNTIEFIGKAYLALSNQASINSEL